MLPQSRDWFASHNYYVLELALGAQSFPLLIFPLLTPAISFWQSSPFILFSLQVWLLAVPAEGKVFYKTLISFSLIPFFNKDFFCSFNLILINYMSISKTISPSLKLPEPSVSLLKLLNFRSFQWFDFWEAEYGGYLMYFMSRKWSGWCSLYLLLNWISVEWEGKILGVKKVRSMTKIFQKQ